MRSYPSDKLPRLTKYPFGIVNSAPSKNREEHWIMIGRLDKPYYLADSLGRKRTTYSFLTKKYWQMAPRKLQKTDNLCGNYAIYSAFLLFKLYQRNLNNFHDVHVLNFIGNFLYLCVFLFVSVIYGKDFIIRCRDSYTFL